MTGLIVANAGIGALGSYMLRRTAESVMLAARLRLVDRPLGRRISALDRAEPGDLKSRVTADTTLLRPGAVWDAEGKPAARRPAGQR
jgi:hypothetical protein